jgi:hypothetical protein
MPNIPGWELLARNHAQETIGISILKYISYYSFGIYIVNIL